MEIYISKTKLSPVIRNGRKFVEVTFGNDNDIRLSLSKEENVLLVGGRAYLRAEDFVLSEFFDRYVKMAFIDYSAIKETVSRKEEDIKTTGRYVHITNTYKSNIKPRCTTYWG